MKNNICILAILLVVLLSGCIEIDMGHEVEQDRHSFIIGVQSEIERDGQSSIIYTMDISGMNDTAQEEGWEMEGYLSEICRELLEANKVDSCQNTEIRMVVAKRLDPASGGYEFTVEKRFPNIAYVFSADKIVSPGAIENDDIKFTDANAKQQAAMYRMMSARITYTIEMPGEITLAENGRIEGNKAVYDVIGLMEDGKTVHVESQELDTEMMLIAGAAILLIIIFAFHFMMGRRGRYRSRF